MDKIYKQIVTIQPGGRVEVTSDQLPAGQQAEVTVRVNPGKPVKSYLALFGSGKGSYTTPEEADAFLRRERDRWEK